MEPEAEKVDAGPRSHQSWQWLSLLPMGLGAWAPLAGAARWGVRSWIIPGLAWLTLWITAIVLAANNAHAHRHSHLPNLLFVLCWVGGAVTSFYLADAEELRWAAEDAAELGIAEDEVFPHIAQPTDRAGRWSLRFGLITYVATFAAALVVGVLLRAGDFRVQVGVGVLITDAFLLSSLVFLKRRDGLVPADLGFQSTNALAAVGFVIAAAALYWLVGGTWLLVFHVHGNDARTLVGVHHPGTVNKVIDIVALAIAAPVVEEVFFRGVLFRCLRNRFPLWPAALIAGCLFGLVHITGYPLVTLPVKALFGVTACLLYERTGSLWPGIALHAFVDGTGVDVSFAHNDWIVLGITGAVILVIVVRAMRLPPGPTSPDPASTVIS